MKKLLKTLRTTLLLAAAAAPAAYAQDKVTMLTSWYAQAEHGGFYQALATGIYKKYNLDVTLKMGGPQVNGMQILAAGQTDFLMSYDFSVLKAIEAGIPAVTVGTSFQYDLQGLLTHEDVPNLGSLKGKTIFVATAGRSNWWPWLKGKYGYAEEQTKPYTFNPQPFVADKNSAMQAYMSSEPFAVQNLGVKAKFHLFAHDGYPPYGTTIVAMKKTVDERADVVQRFVRASIEGWKSYMANPGPANELIKKDNPNMTDDTIAFAIKRMKELDIFWAGPAKTEGLGSMREERFKATYDMLVASGLLDPKVDWKKTFTTQFVKDLRVLP